jgi:hypothetical protein
MLYRRAGEHLLNPSFEMRPVVEVIICRPRNLFVGEWQVGEISDGQPVCQRDVLLAWLAEPTVEDAVLVSDAAR